MGLAGADNIGGVELVELPSAKTVDYARGNACGAEQQRHGGGEVLAVSAAAVEEKVGNRVVGRTRWKLQGVGVAGGEVVFDGESAEIRSRLGAGELAGEIGDARVELLRELEIALGKRWRVGSGWGGGGCPRQRSRISVAGHAVGRGSRRCGRDVGCGHLSHPSRKSRGGRWGTHRGQRCIGELCERSGNGNGDIGDAFVEGDGVVGVEVVEGQLVIHADLAESAV